MSIGTEELLQFGCESCQSTSEVMRRAAVSRAYYAGYHAASSWHDALSVPGTCQGNGGVHSQLISRLANPMVAEGQLKSLSRQIAYLLKDCKSDRELADYFLDRQLDAVAAATAVEKVRALMGRMQKTSSNKSAITSKAVAATAQQSDEPPASPKPVLKRIL